MIDLRIIGTLAALIYIFALWTGYSTLLWCMWMTMFCSPEAIAFIRGIGTFSGFEWYMRASANEAKALFGSLIYAVFGLMTFHFWIAPDFAPWLKDSVKTHGIIGGILLVASYITSRMKRARNGS